MYQIQPVSKPIMGSPTSDPSDMDSNSRSSITLEGEVELISSLPSFKTKDAQRNSKSRSTGNHINPSFSMPVQNWYSEERCDSPTLAPCHVTRYDQPITHNYKNNGQETKISMSAFHLTEPETVPAVDECFKDSDRGESFSSSRCDSLNSLLSWTTQSSTRETSNSYAQNQSNQTMINKMTLNKPKFFSQVKSTSGSYKNSKRMFGEHGWLGFFPEETVTKEKRDYKKPLGAREKISVMGKLRSKIGVIAALYSLPNSRACREESNRNTSSVIVSLGAKEQFNLFMEVELTIVNTANEFLMKSFSLALLSVDSIKDTIYSWERKGNQIVKEFMYDQATQRELVVSNHKNLRFHGKQARDQEQITAMLSNWKQVIELIEICTFRTADTIILRMLFDVQYILEFLGASDSIMLRIQEIRNSVVKNMRLNYQPSYDYV